MVETKVLPQNVKIFGLTPDDLLMRLRMDVDLETLTEDEVELVKNYRALTDEARKLI